MDEQVVSEVETEKGSTEEQTEDKVGNEESILNCLQYLLRLNGIEKSVASIRETADMSSGGFNFEDAVSVFRNLEFSANVGILKAQKIKEGHCPSILIFKDETVLVLVKADRKAGFTFYNPETPQDFLTLSYSELKSRFNQN